MAKTKVDGFTDEDVRLAEIAKVLAHPARIRILQILTESQSCITGEIVDLLPLSQSTVSQHLKELKRVKLIQGEIDGPKTCYCINPEEVAKAKEMFTNLFTTITQVCC